MTVDDSKNIDSCFSDDPHNLLDLAESSVGQSKTEDQRLFDAFKEILDFYEKNNREPEDSKKNFSEAKLFLRLNALRADSSKVQKLQAMDCYKLLKKDVRDGNSIDELIADDVNNILEDDMDIRLFDMENVPKSDRIHPDYYARRKKCDDFDQFKNRFASLHDDLAKGVRKLVAINRDDIHAGKYYVLNGVVLYLSELCTEKKESKYDSGVRVRLEGRTRCIFDNGTEVDMTFRSLVKALDKDGFAISDLLNPINTEDSVLDSDVQDGFIYVLKTESTNPELMKYEDLYKIGFTKSTVESRIKNAAQSPTYLMADVSVEGIYKCLNFSTSKLEKLLHKFFDTAQLNINLQDSRGNRYRPQEWFDVPLQVIDEAVKLAITGDLDNHFYDSSIRMLVLKR